MKCLETRQRGGMRWRRYRDEHGAIHTTLEAPEEVVRTLGAKRLAEELARAKRNSERKVLNARATKLVAEGWKPEAVAHELSLSAPQVRKLRSISLSCLKPAR